MAQSRQGKRTDPDVRDYIVDHALEGWSPAAILRAVQQDAELASRAPGIRAIQGIVKQATTRDGSAWWSATRATADELRRVLPVLADLYDVGVTRQITLDEAAMVAKLKSYADDMPTRTTWRLARAALSADGRVEAFLAYTPWRDGGLRYARAFASNRVADFSYSWCETVSAEAEAVLRASAEASKESRHGA